MNKVFIFCGALAISACASLPSNRPVTLVAADGEVRTGALNYDTPYTGVLLFKGQQDQESFSGRYTVVDKTAVKRSSGTIVVPSSTSVPGIGTASSTENKEIQAEGFWAAKGDKGTSIRCTLKIGLQGHGNGTCTTNTGESYEITL